MNSPSVFAQYYFYCFPCKPNWSPHECFSHILANLLAILVAKMLFLLQGNDQSMSWMCSFQSHTFKKCRSVYNFPTTAPILVLMVDIYKVGSHQSFKRKTDHLVAACTITGFACCESVTTVNALSFVAAIMKIQLRYGIAHNLAIDKDSQFYGTFKDTTSLFKINIHTLSSGNHDTMLVEQINWFLIKTLKIFCNKRGFIPVAVEGILLSLYAWNSATIPGTDISCSLVVVGWEF